MNSEHPYLHPDNFEKHDCSGAECPYCSSFPTGKSTFKEYCGMKDVETLRTLRTLWEKINGSAATIYRTPPSTSIPKIRPSVTLTQQKQLDNFCDGRGYAVKEWPKCILPSVTIIMPHGNHWNEGGPWNVLCHLRSDNGFWGFPGGAQNIGESIVQCAKREMLEETGVHAHILGAVALDSDPCKHAICSYDDGTVQYTNVTFLATWITGDLMPSDESLFLRWCHTDNLPQPFLKSHRWRLHQAMAHHGSYISVL